MIFVKTQYKIFKLIQQKKDVHSTGRPFFIRSLAYVYFSFALSTLLRSFTFLIQFNKSEHSIIDNIHII